MNNPNISSIPSRRTSDTHIFKMITLRLYSFVFVADQYDLVLPENAPHGVYFMEIGLYHAESGRRPDVDFSDKGIALDQIRVGN